MGAVGIALALLGPYGSYAMGSLAARLAYWLPAAFGGYLIVRPTVLLAVEAGRRLALPQAAALGTGVLIAALPMTLFIPWLNGDRFGHLPRFEIWIQLYAQIALIGAGVTLLFWLLERPRPEQGAAPQELASAGVRAAEPPLVPAGQRTDERPPFFARLPAHLRDGLLALEMEDHYVRAHGAGGSALILLRMRDAVAELAGTEGMQVHRSWWVARNAVESVVQEGRNVRLTLRGGIEAPVARSSVPTLRASGWLD